MTSYPPPPDWSQGGAPTPPPPYGPGGTPYGPGGTPYGPGGTPFPPGAHLAAPQKVLVPPVAWLVPLAGVVALIGGVTKWFQPEMKATYQGKTITQAATDSVFSWDDGKIGLLGPILLILIGVGVAGLLMGRSPNRFGRGSHPVNTAGKYAIGAGVVAVVCTVISWVMVKSQYKFSEDGRNYSWDGYIKLAKDSGIKLEISRSPQIGFYLTIVAAVLAIVGGALMIAMHRKADV